MRKYYVLIFSLTFYGGVNEIGENKILFQDKDTKVFLDFGMNRVQSHCSGHARGQDLLEAVSEINAKTLFQFILSILIYTRKYQKMS